MFPPWSRNTPRSSPLDQYTSFRLSSRFFYSTHQFRQKIVKIFVALPLYHRILVILVSFFFGISLVLVLVYNERIFGFLAPYAERWRGVRGGWLILWALTFLTAFPPLIGYSSTITISGFVYGFPNGWFIVATATVCGSLASFIASRTIISEYVHRLVGQDHRFNALALTLKHDGLKILCMIRLCPLPYSVSNAAMSTFPTVQPLSFALATALASPKLLIHVFIGSRMAAIADARQDQRLDSSTKAINYLSIIAGIILGVVVGWIIYRRTISRARELNTTELEEDVFDTSNSFLISEQFYSDTASLSLADEDLST